MTALRQAGLGLVALIAGALTLHAVELGDFAANPWAAATTLLAAIAAVVALTHLAGRTGRTGRLPLLGVPALFAMLVLFLWETLTRGFGVPEILLPPPSLIGRAFWTMQHDLLLDVRQTVLYAALPGYLVGTALGMLTGIAVDRSLFLQRGLVPLSSFASVIPIVGVAPIMIMWFGFGWQSKAAVVILMTFFPAFVNMVAGLAEASTIERDLMTSYAATYRQTLWKLRLPASLPFLFAALKINASLALIGSIVAEFFGTPLHGIGFRVSEEIGHLALDRVWAAILVAALVGSSAYALLALAERFATFWHPTQLGLDEGKS